MRTETDKRRQPIVEWWRVGAVVLIVTVAMLFVHAIEPADAGVMEPASSPAVRSDR